LLLLAVPVFADNGPHVKNMGTTPDSCAGCHRAHSAQAADITIQAQPLLCYNCHGSGSAGATTDVKDGMLFADALNKSSARVALATNAALRGGGFEYALLQTNAYYAPSTGPFNEAPLAAAVPATHGTSSAHSVDGNAVAMWGNGVLGTSATAKVTELECTSCHDPHGNGQYRILKPAPTDADTTAVSGVYINDVPATGGAYARTPVTPVMQSGVTAPAGTGTAGAYQYRYFTTNYGDMSDPNSAVNADGSAIMYAVIPATSSVPIQRNYYGNYTETSSRWCTMCHTRYLSPTDGASTDSTDATFKYRHAQRTLVDAANPLATTAAVQLRTDWATLAAATPAITPLTAGLGVGLYINNEVGAARPFVNFPGPLTLGYVYDSACARIDGVPVVPNDAANGSSASSRYDSTFVEGCSTGAAPGVSISMNVASPTVKINNKYKLAIQSHDSKFSHPNTFTGKAYLLGEVLGAAGAVNAGSGPDVTGAADGRLTTSPPRCLQCHVSHGSNASADTNSTSPSVSFTDADLTASPAASSGSRLLRLDNRGMCQSCHKK
jgi:predicted CXXCH cytochrome family protein